MSHLTSARVAAIALWLTGIGVGVSATIGQRPEVFLWLAVAAGLMFLLDHDKASK